MFSPHIDGGTYTTQLTSCLRTPWLGVYLVHRPAGVLKQDAMGAVHVRLQKSEAAMLVVVVVLTLTRIIKSVVSIHHTRVHFTAAADHLPLNFARETTKAVKNVAKKKRFTSDQKRQTKTSYESHA